MGRGVLLAVILPDRLSLALLKDRSRATPAASIRKGCLAAQVAKNGNTETFGLALFHGFSFPFEVTSVLLVIAVLGAVVLGSARFGRDASA